MPDPVPSGVARLKSRTHQVVERGIDGALRRFSGLRDQPSTTRRDGVFPTRGAGVGLVRCVVGVVHLAHDEDVAAAADRVGEGGDRLEYAVRGVALCLVRAGTVEAP